MEKANKIKSIVEDYEIGMITEKEMMNQIAAVCLQYLNQQKETALFNEVYNKLK